jgi:hypothetical protein
MPVEEDYKNERNLLTTIMRMLPETYHKVQLLPISFSYEFCGNMITVERDGDRYGDDEWNIYFTYPSEEGTRTQVVDQKPLAECFDVVISMMT